MGILCRMDFEYPSVKIPLRIYSSYTLSNRNDLFPRISRHVGKNLLDGSVKHVRSESELAMTYFAGYISSKYFTAPQEEVAVSSL